MGNRLGKSISFLKKYFDLFIFQQGDKGYCYIPYGYLTDSDFCFDPWTVRRLETDDMGHEHWDDDDSVDYQQDDDEDGDEDDEDGDDDCDIEEGEEEEEEDDDDGDDE